MLLWVLKIEIEIIVKLKEELTSSNAFTWKWLEGSRGMLARVRANNIREAVV